MSKGISDIPEADADVGNVDSGEISTNQQAIPVPIFAGEAKFALKWLSDPIGQFVKDAPTERPGKK